ncbi:hypothetical protein BJ085DRAFT_32059 [Dimargaris cristalligena]|uniref:Uncharacterized protein n=1 Tax=Dimargaris cristalligena TaxID=215637 RepID=A0A4P9ZNJ1_9FUNG|nr:hypothetical protein BJ085DRAFT_32059 [Dimargaris cristalligena]|eukprot:RKP34112.1 hypothetical protein BJ085DRAFT_32059 [Dimargaris cristalligena]
MVVTFKLAGFWWEGALLAVGLALLFQVSPPDGFRMHPTGMTLAYLTIAAFLIMRRYRLGHHWIKPYQREGEAKSSQVMTFMIPVGSGKSWLSTTLALMWIVFICMYIEAAAVLFAVYADPATPTDWHSWLTSAIIQQVTIAFTAAVYHLLYFESDFQSIIKKKPRRIPRWLQFWVVAAVYHAWELGQLLLTNSYPNNSPFSAGLFTRYITLGIVVTKLLLIITCVAIPHFIMWYHAAGIFSTIKLPPVPLALEVKKKRVASAKLRVSDSIPYTHYSARVLCTRTFRIIYDLVFPLDASMAYRLASNWAIEFFTQWTRTFEPGYYKDLLDSLASRELAFPTLAKYGVASIVNEMVIAHMNRKIEVRRVRQLGHVCQANAFSQGKILPC